jgi:hypothetical protein
VNVHYEQLLIRPTVMQLVSALGEAQGVANATSPALSVKHEEWMQAIAEARGKPEGFREWNGARYNGAGAVAMVWWADHAGRRQFRVLAERWPGRTYEARDNLITRGHPPVWVFSWPNCFLRAMDGRAAWVVACECGEVGSATELGWMGARCAACHDRAEEGEPRPVRARLGEGSCTELLPDVSNFAVRPAAEGHGVVLRRRRDDTVALAHSLPVNDEGHPVACDWAITRDERAFAVVANQLWLFRRRGEDWTMEWSHDGTWAGPNTVAEDGSRVAVNAGLQPAVFGPGGEAEPVEPLPHAEGWELSMRQLCFGSGGRALHVLLGPRPEDTFGMAAPVLATWERGAEGWKAVRHESFPGMRGCWFSPCGDWLGRADEDQPGVTFLDLRTGRPIGRLAAYLDLAVEDVAFMEDGETVAFVYPEREEPEGPGPERRCTLVPWRLLLGLGPVGDTMTT